MNFDNLGETTETEGLEPGDLGEADMLNEFGFAGESAGKRRFGETTIVVVAALLVAAGGLYGMRWLGSQSGATQTDGMLEAKVEAFLQSIVGSKKTVAEAKQTTADPDAIKRRLADDRTKKQVPVDEVKQNPFIRTGDPTADSGQFAAQPEVRESVDPAEIERQRRIRLHQRLEDVASELWVTSILGREGRRIAQIEMGTEKFHVGVGQKVVVDIETTFVVRRIDELSVLLESDGFDFTLALGE